MCITLSIFKITFIAIGDALKYFPGRCCIFHYVVLLGRCPTCLHWTLLSSERVRFGGCFERTAEDWKSLNCLKFFSSMRFKLTIGDSRVLQKTRGIYYISWLHLQHLPEIAMPIITAITTFALFVKAYRCGISLLFIFSGRINVFLENCIV